MDIFVIEANNINYVDESLLKEFQKKEIKLSKKQKIHSLSYLMLDRILRDFYHIEHRELIFQAKKPFLKDKKKFFSISHSGDFIVLAFSDYDCGVDIEKIKHRDYVAIANRMGFKSCETLRDFYIEWTKYEAEFKLGKVSQVSKFFDIEGYIIAAVSENTQEEFEIYFQSGNVFPNAGK